MFKFRSIVLAIRICFQNDIAKVCADIEQFTQYIHYIFINTLKYSYLRLPAGKQKLSKTVVAVGNLPHVPALLCSRGRMCVFYVRAG